MNTIMNEQIRKMMWIIHNNYCPTMIGESKTDMVYLNTNDIYRIAEALSEAGFSQPRCGTWEIEDIEDHEFKNGHLCKNYRTIYTCSLCKTHIVNLKNMKYCPDCGAKMK